MFIDIYDIVQASRDLSSTVKAGATGTVLQVYNDKPTPYFLIEFMDSNNDFADLVTASENDITPINKNLIYKEAEYMGTLVGSNSLEDNRFKSISDFKDCMARGGEVEFEYMSKDYSIAHTESKIVIAQPYKPETEKMCADADEVLEYRMDGVRLRDVITEVTVLARTI